MRLLIGYYLHFFICMVIFICYLVVVSLHFGARRFFFIVLLVALRNFRVIFYFVDKVQYSTYTKEI